MRKLLIVLLVIVLAISGVGCGTFVAIMSSGHPVFYGGVQVDFVALFMFYGVLIPFVLIDFPICLVIETLLLPISIQYPPMDWGGVLGRR